MGLLPENHADRIAFFTSRTALWNTNHVAIGTSTTNITAVTTAATAASAALAAQLNAQNTAKAATEALLSAMNTLTNAGMIVIEQVRTQSRISGDDVFPLANIPGPTTPTPVGDLAKPENFSVTLDETGEINIAWKCAQPKSATAVTYNVWRKLGTAGDWACLGGTGEKNFTDATLPAGTAVATYKVQATRSTSRSPWAQFVVNFGVEMSSIESIVETPAAKIAA